MPFDEEADVEDPRQGLPIKNETRSYNAPSGGSGRNLDLIPDGPDNFIPDGRDNDGEKA
jgi:hypothetical protein